MSGYFKIKRPFATKTEDLQGEVVKGLAEALKETENDLKRELDEVRDYKIIVKKIGPMYTKIDKDPKSKDKIKELLSKKFDEEFDKFITKWTAHKTSIREHKEKLLASLEPKKQQ